MLERMAGCAFCSSFLGINVCEKVEKITILRLRMRIGSQTAERRIGETQKVSKLSRKLEAREDTFGAAPEERGHTEAVKEAQRREKVLPSKWVPKKVATPGTFFDTMRMSSSEEED